MRNPELWHRLESTPITLSDGTDLGVVLTDRYDIRPVVAAALLTEYRRFLYLAAVLTGPVAPSPAIAQVAQAHRQDAAGWQAYGQAMFGRDLAVPAKAAAGHDPAYQRSLKALTQEFGTTPKAPIWPGQQDFASQEGKAGLVRILGVIAAIPIGWTFGIGFGLLALAFGVFILPRAVSGDSKFALQRRSDGSDGSGSDHPNSSAGSRSDGDNSSSDSGGSCD